MAVIATQFSDQLTKVLRQLMRVYCIICQQYLINTRDCSCGIGSSLTAGTCNQKMNLTTDLRSGSNCIQRCRFK
jgi:hypothetical protein